MQLSLAVIYVFLSPSLSSFLHSHIYLSFLSFHFSPLFLLLPPFLVWHINQILSKSWWWVVLCLIVLLATQSSWRQHEGETHTGLTFLFGTRMRWNLAYICNSLFVWAKFIAFCEEYHYSAIPFFYYNVLPPHILSKSSLPLLRIFCSTLASYSKTTLHYWIYCGIIMRWIRIILKLLGYSTEEV